MANSPDEYTPCSENNSAERGRGSGREDRDQIVDLLKQPDSYTLLSTSNPDVPPTELSSIFIQPANQIKYRILLCHR